MKVLKEMNEMRLSAQATLFEMTEHFFRLWELWLSLTTSRRDEPASFFQVLLLTMPTQPEGPVVLVRREIAKMIRLDESPLLRDIDGEKGLFAAMESYGEELGMSKAVPATLNALNGGGGGVLVSGAGETKCDECRAFACKKQDEGKCICKHDSKFSLSNIEQKGRREYVALMRRYNKANPKKSLQVKVKVVREALGEAPKEDKKEKETNGKVTFMASVKEVLGDEASDAEAVDKWLEEHADGEFFVLGETANLGNSSAVGELQFQVIEDDVKDNTARELALDEASGSASGTTSGSSARTAHELMAHELELERMKSKLMMANARVSELEAKERAAVAAAPLAGAPTPATAKRPNPALDPPKRMSFLQMTPKQIYQKIWDMPEETKGTPATAAPPVRQKYTPKEAPITEDAGSAGGKITSTEHFARGLVASEVEKRQKVQKSKAHLRALGEMLLYGHVHILHFAKHILTQAWAECTTHGILTSSLLVVVFGPYMKPMAKLLLTKLGVIAARFTLARVTDAIEGMRALLRNFSAAVVAKLVATALQQATPPAAATSAASVPLPTPASAPASSRAGPTTIDGGDQGGTLMSLGEHLGNSVLMTKSELPVEDGLKPGLMDDGASSNTSCAKTLEGAIPGTYLASDAGSIGLGSDGATLASEGSYLYALKRHGVNTSEMVVRRLKHTPRLPMPYVFSEAGENTIHKYGIYWEPNKARVLKSPKGQVIELFMSSSHLGWLKVQPVSDEATVLEMLRQYKRDQVMGTPHLAMINAPVPGALACPMDPAAVRTVNMGKVKPLTGVELLRRRHITDGHASLPITVKNLKAEGAFERKLLTLKDVELFAAQGCGACELTKMRRRPFTAKVEQDTAPPKLGKVFTFDVLQLRVPAEHTGATYLYVAIEKVSKFAIGGSMRGYSEAHVQPECGAFSASRYEQPGPPVLFDKSNVDGIPDEDGELPLEVQQALNDVRFCADLFRQTAGTDKICMLEYPASQGTGSPFSAKGREMHSTIADTTIMCALTAELRLETVFTEQGASGAASRKPTALLTTKNGAHALRRTVGTLFVQPGTKFDKVVGAQEEDGTYKTKALGRYTAKFAMQLSIALLESLPSSTRQARLQAELNKQSEPATDNLYPTGTRVELYWYGERRWYRGTVIDTRVRKGMVHGAAIARREIQVRYDDDESVLWHAICDYAVREVPAESSEPEEVVLAALAARAEPSRTATTLCVLDGETTPPVVLDGEAVRATGTTPSDSAVTNSTQDDGTHAPPLEAHLGELFTVRRLLFDLESAESVGREIFYAVLGDGSVEAIDVSGAQSWHVPQNEKEYNRSPQRDLWRTAKELKMDEYASIDMYDLVLESSVDKTKYKIFDTLWAYKIKFKKNAAGDTIFDKLNPRWCVMGGGMDRALYKSWAEQARASSVNIMWGMKGLYYKQLAAGQYDMKNAFQSTRTVDEHGNLLEGENEFYTRQAPGFVQYGPNGEPLVCRQKCFIQGRIDATRGFDKFITNILVKDCNLAPLLWDSKLYQYNHTPLAGTTASLDEIIGKATEMHLAGVDADAQQPPRGYGLFAMHVDDLCALATGCLVVENNRIFSFVRGKIEVAYAVKLTAWDKLLGFETHLDDQAETVTITAQAAVDGVRAKLFSKEILTITPRHAVTESVYESCPGVVPEVGDPARARYLENQELIRHVLGVGIWMTNAYPQMGAAINSMCVNMANPGMERLGQLRHLFMYLGEKPQGKIFGGKHVTGCCAGVKEVAPFTAGAKSGEYHYFSDASINVTGGVGMFAGCCIQPLMLRQHLASPSAHTSEIVAAGTNMNHMLPVNGVLQELHIRQGRPTRVYFDSQSTVYVASSDTAPKKSVWLARRNKVLTECVEHNEAEPIHIGEADMIADSFTKYVKRETWTRHMHYILNLPGDPPDCHDADWVRVPTVKSKPKNKAKPKVVHKA